MPFPAAYGNFSDLFIVRFVPPASLPTYRKRQVTEIFRPGNRQMIRVVALMPLPAADSELSQSFFIMLF